MKSRSANIVVFLTAHHGVFLPRLQPCPSAGQIYSLETGPRLNLHELRNYDY